MSGTPFFKPVPKYNAMGTEGANGGPNPDPDRAFSPVETSSGQDQSFFASDTSRAFPAGANQASGGLRMGTESPRGGPSDDPETTDFREGGSAVPYSYGHFGSPLDQASGISQAFNQTGAHTGTEILTMGTESPRGGPSDDPDRAAAVDTGSEGHGRHDGLMGGFDILAL